MESQPQNPELRNNSENFHPCIYKVSTDKTSEMRDNDTQQLTIYNAMVMLRKVIMVIGRTRKQWKKYIMR